jgi:hypothetical protein
MLTLSISCGPATRRTPCLRPPTTIASGCALPMNADAFDLLRASDPADTMPETPDDYRERLRKTIISSPTDEPERAQHTRPRRRIALAAIVIGALLLLCGTAVYAGRSMVTQPPLDPAPTPSPDALLTARQVRAEYRLWTHKIALPDGAKWPREQLGKGGEGPGDTYGGNTGVMDAITWAVCAWSREWVAAADAQDEVRIAAAAEALERIVNVMPEWHEGMTENQGGWDSTAIDSFKGAVAAGKQGDLTGVRQFAGWFDDED